MKRRGLLNDSGCKGVRTFGAKQSLAWGREAVQRAVVDTLESRTLLSTTFANLQYTDPFPPAAQLGQASQPPSSVLYTESFTDQAATNGVLGATDRYWSDQATVTRTLPSSMQNGLSQTSVEFWLNVSPGTYIGDGPVMTMPGFQVNGSWQLGGTPAGAMSMTFTTTRAGDPLENLGTAMVVIADGQWHQYVATFDGHTAFFYADGQLANQSWRSNSANKVGPQVFSNSTLSTPSAITYTPVGSANTRIDEVRVSNVALTPWQVQRNFQNDRNFINTYYVAPNGQSTNSGTRAAPIDLTTAMSRVGPDVKLVLLPGTYNGAQFQVTASGASPLRNALITGDDGSAQVIIQTIGSGAGPSVSAGVKYVTLRNLTFNSDQQAGLSFSSTGLGNVIDGCRLTSNVDALSVVNTSGYPVSGTQYTFVAGLTLENSVLAGGASSAGARYSNSKIISVRNNTFVGGQYGAFFTGGSADIGLQNNIFTGQSGSGVYFNSDSLSYGGNSNIYNPAGGGYVATVVDGTTRTYSTVSDYTKYWYTKQYGAAILNGNDSGAGIGYRNEARSFRGAPVFMSSVQGDYRLAAIAPNLVDTSSSTTVWDGQGNPRGQGNAGDAGAYETAGAVSHAFTLATAATTSAGVYDSTGKLVRTLWSGVKYPAGSVTAYWNGLDDNNSPMSNGSYSIKLLSNNVQYVWDGAINNSFPLTGPNVQGNFYPIESMVIVGNTAYYNPGYNEGRYQLYKFSLSNIHQLTGYAFGPSGTDSDYVNSIASDGTTLYALWQPHGSSTSTIKSHDLNLNFTGLSVNVGATAFGVSSIAVQPAQQNLLFASYPADNRIYIYNKSNFTPYSTPYLSGAALGWNSPQSIATTPDGDLWVTSKNTASGQWQVVRYTNFAGTPTLQATASGFVNPLGIAVSIDGNKTLMVADGESGTSISQQIKAYTPAGASLWTLGQAGGYAANGSTITNDKFILQGMIAPQADGSFWITDLATENRTMHFSAARTFIEDIQYTRSYVAAGDQNNATRVFQNFVEYQIDYSKPYTQNQGWTPLKNWSYLGTKNLLPFSNYGGSQGFKVLATLSNGRTYALVDAPVISGNPADNFRLRMVELTAAGLRDTGYMTPPNVGMVWLQKDGSLIYGGVSNGMVGFNRLALMGFDALGNPQYAASATVLGTAPWSATWDSQSPATNGMPYYGPAFQQLDNGLLVSYNAQVHAAGMHLGAVNPTTNQWQWQSMPGVGSLDGKGNFDTNAWYGGNRVMASGRNIIAGYNGEGWRNQGQANQFMHYNDDGLFIGQFGTPLLNGGNSWPSPYGFSGNSFSPFLTTNGNSLYLYANDESSRGLQRWHATGLDTIQETSLGVILGVPAAPSGLNVTLVSQNQIDLAWTDTSNNETGFKVDRATDSGFTLGLTTVTVGANVTTCNSTGLTANTTYYYRVRATNSGGDSANSNTAGPVMPLLQVNGDQGSAGQSDRIRVARNLANPSLLDVFLNGATPTYSVSFAALNTIVINGLGGDDTLTLDLANGPVTPAGGISYDGGIQISGDSLIIVGSSGDDGVTFSANQATIGSGTVTLTGVENRSFKGGAGNDSLTLGAGSYTFATDLGLDTTHLSLALSNGAQVAFSGVQHLSSLVLSGGSKVTLADGGQSTLVVQNLSGDATSSLDLADNAMIVDYTGSSPFAAIYSLVASSAANGWSGNGIVSHTAASGGSQYALGTADNSSPNLTTFAGQAVDGTSVLIRFTYAGDANLDGQVDLTDLSILASSWQMAGRQLSQGNFNYSSLVDLTDLSLLASNWQKILPTPLGMAASLSIAAASGQSATSPPLGQFAAVAPVAPVVIANVQTNPVRMPVTRKRPIRISPVKAARQPAGVFSNHPLAPASALATWPITSHGIPTLLWTDRRGVNDRDNVLVSDTKTRPRHNFYSLSPFRHYFHGK